MGDLTVTDAIMQRGAVRAFAAREVNADLVSEILALAANSPSDGNRQPWQVIAVSGDVKARLCSAVRANGGVTASQAGQRIDSGYRDSNYVDRNYEFHGAPVGLIVTMRRDVAASESIAIGIFVQSILLLAQERGLATCPQAAWVESGDVVRQELGIPEDETVMLGIALGYAQADDPVNHQKQARTPLSGFARLLGFADSETRH